MLMMCYMNVLVMSVINFNKDYPSDNPIKYEDFSAWGYAEN